MGSTAAGFRSFGTVSSAVSWLMPPILHHTASCCGVAAARRSAEKVKNNLYIMSSSSYGCVLYPLGEKAVFNWGTICFSEYFIFPLFQRFQISKLKWCLTATVEPDSTSSWIQIHDMQLGAPQYSGSVISWAFPFLCWGTGSKDSFQNKGGVPKGSNAA